MLEVVWSAYVLRNGQGARMQGRIHVMPACYSYVARIRFLHSTACVHQFFHWRTQARNTKAATTLFDAVYGHILNHSIHRYRQRIVGDCFTRLT